MTTLFYHHVGVEGSADFDKTVFREVEFETVANGLALAGLRNDSSIGPATSGQVERRLGELFPTGRFHCWGVPAKAHFVIKRLMEGDYVLLLRTTKPGGDMPALCPIQFFLRSQLPDLSQLLWGSERFPYIFFFQTIPLTLLWPQFHDHLGYNGYDPMGRFLSVAHHRLLKFGGVEGYIQYLLTHYQDSETVSVLQPDTPGVIDIPAIPHQLQGLETSFEGRSEGYRWPGTHGEARYSDGPPERYERMQMDGPGFGSRAGDNGYQIRGWNGRTA